MIKISFESQFFLNLNYIGRYIVINLIRVLLRLRKSHTQGAKDPHVAREPQFADHCTRVLKG